MVDLRTIKLDPSRFENKVAYNAALYGLDCMIELQKLYRKGYRLVDKYEGLVEMKFKFRNGNELFLNNRWIFGDTGAMDGSDKVYCTKGELNEYFRTLKLVHPKNIVSFSKLIK